MTMAISNSTLKAGTILDSGDTRYRIVDVLGQGGFGITYLAMGEFKKGNVTTEGKFAIKEHFPSAFCSREGNDVRPKDDKTTEYGKSKADFVAEARKLHDMGCENDNIVKVNELFEANGTAYYVMQYINGVSLTSYVESRGRLSYKEAVELLAPIVDAVGFLHKARINHLDIKPDNIMLHEGFEGKVPVLIDFGLSVHFKKNGDKTSPKGVMGVSEGYSPLEQYAGIKEFNPATDIYSLAATFVYALTGLAPKGAAELKLADVRAALSRVAGPEAVDGLCKALNKSYEDRTASIGAFKADLGLAGGGTVTEVITVDDEKKARTRKMMLIGACAVAIVLLCALLRFGCSGGGAFEEPEVNCVEVVEEVPVLPAEALEPEVQEETPPAKEPEQAPQEDVKPQSNVKRGELPLGYGVWSGGIRGGKPDGKGRLDFSTAHRVDPSTGYEAKAGDYFIATYDRGSLISGKLYDGTTGELIKTIIP